MPQHNPAVSASQYRLAQAVLSGTARAVSMSPKAAQEIIDRTPAKLRSQFMKRNQTLVGSAITYDLVGRALPGVTRRLDKVTRSLTRNNPTGAAVKSYRDFHGRDPERDTIIDTEVHEHSVLPGIGELCWIYVRYEDEDGDTCDVKLERFKGTLLCSNEERLKRPQLYFQGGDQAVDCSQFGIRIPLHEMETLGRMVCVSYYTTKDHLGEDGGEAEYVHVIEMPLNMREFKEWGLEKIDPPMTWEEVEEETEGALGPDVIYDTRNRLLMLSGGSYTIPDEGIEH